MGNVSRDLRFSVDPTLETQCLFLEEKDLDGFQNTSHWLESSNFSLDWTAVERIFLNFSLTTVTLQPLGPYEAPDCFKVG